ncbi:MAG: prepilin-type N-terminal cleavage/methylation domain-containing protein [Deltaproteobacteria bacterium]|nr:prepilin-type N-terminal cleavage/methylation domain-containing protein [Deltaproteobacteria bacterium]
MLNVLNDKNTKGFSLVEILTVVAILAIVLTISIPMFSSFVKNRNLKEAAAALMSDIKFAKQRSMTENIHYIITIDKDNNDYSVQDCCNTTDCSAKGCSYNATKNLGDFGNGVMILDNTYNTITFQSRGTCSAGHVDLQNSIGSSIKIITTQMGRVRSEETFK